MGKIRKGPGTRASGYVDEILATVEALRSDGTGLGDLKIAHAALMDALILTLADQDAATVECNAIWESFY